MCNLYTQTKSVDEVARLFRDLQMPLRYPQGIPNLQPREIRITEPAPIVRSGGEGIELVLQRWSWPAPNGKPVYNFRSDGREFKSGRCLIIADAFYEFTPQADPQARLKHKWEFRLRNQPMFAIAGLWRADAKVGDAFTMLTTAPGDDMRPYHNRQVVVLSPIDFGRWLDPSAACTDLLKPLPEGSLEVRLVR